ncbi:MAG: IscA/HesB family protein [Desulfovibrionaceae bacterium]|jgi:Fe-S cluster assembly iron-binding protein IscA|nr:IscA/HesB family protein [Desulfovibrionaceae bacterium]
MITLTQDALAELDAYFNDKEKSPIRIFLTAGGCSGPKLALALDEAKEEDTVVEVDGYTFLGETELLEAAKPLTIKMGPMGFSIESSLQLANTGGCSSCGGSCSC